MPMWSFALVAYVVLGIAVTLATPNAQQALLDAFKDEDLAKGPAWKRHVFRAIVCTAFVVLSPFIVVIGGLLEGKSLWDEKRTAENLPLKKEQALFGGGSGDSFDTAVVVNADDSSVGVGAEYAYIANECGAPHKNWKLQSQALRNHAGKPYDVLTIALSSGETRIFYFDITRFFRK